VVLIGLVKGVIKGLLLYDSVATAYAITSAELFWSISITYSI